jgi:hypothetical protein
MSVKSTPSRRAAVLAATVIFAALAGRAVGYGLDFKARGDTVQHVGPGDFAEFHFTLTNTGNQSDVYELDCRVVSAVPGWAATYCVRGRCVEPGILMYDSLPAGNSDTSISVAVYTNATEGEEIVSMRVRSMGDTTLAESIGTYTIVGSGIEELPGTGAPGVRFQVAPAPVRRGRQMTLSFASARPLSFSVDLFDAAGGWVSLVARGTVHGGRHAVNWRPDRLLGRGVYLLRLTAGGSPTVRKLVVE